MSTPREVDASEAPKAPDTVVIYTSIRGLASAVISPALLLILGVGSLLTSDRIHPVPVVIVIAAVVLGGIVAFDYPRHCRFDAQGVTRVCAGRSQTIPWTRIAAIERAPRSTAGRVRHLVGERRGTGHATGGLVARGVRRGRWLLTDRGEGAAEHDRLRQLVRGLGIATIVRADRPRDGAAPSDLYRRT